MRLLATKLSMKNYREYWSR